MRTAEEEKSTLLKHWYFVAGRLNAIGGGFFTGLAVCIIYTPIEVYTNFKVLTKASESFAGEATILYLLSVAFIIGSFSVFLPYFYKFIVGIYDALLFSAYFAFSVASVFWLLSIITYFQMGHLSSSLGESAIIIFLFSTIFFLAISPAVVSAGFKPKTLGDKIVLFLLFIVPGILVAIFASLKVS